MRSVLASSPLKLSMFDRDPLMSLSGGNTSLGSASVDLSPLLSSRTFWSSRKYYTVELTERGASTTMEQGSGKAASLGRLYLSVRWDCDDDHHQADMGPLLRWFGVASSRLLDATAKCIVNPLGKDQMAIPAHHLGKAWAARQYYMTTHAGPRAGKCSNHPVSLGWLDQMMEEGHLPRDLKVWRVEGGEAWVTLSGEISQVLNEEAITLSN